MLFRSLKLRKQGLKWARGKNLQRMVGRFLLELQLQDSPSYLQRLVLSKPFVASFSQKLVLLFECTFPMVLMGQTDRYIYEVYKWGIVFFGVSFHYYLPFRREGLY